MKILRGYFNTPYLIIKIIIMTNKNILLIGGTHGNEVTGIKLVRHLNKKPISGIEPIIGNERAVAKNVRFVETDLNRSSGKLKPRTYEERLANNLKHKITKASFVVEFHNTTARNNTCAIITSKPNSLHFALAKSFGIDRVLIMPAKGSLSGLRSKRFFSLEISNNDTRFTNIQFLLRKLKNISNLGKINYKKLKIYKFSDILVTKAVAEKVGVDISKLVNFRAFTPKELGLLKLPTNSKTCPIFIGEKAYGKSFGFYVAKLL